MAVPKLRFRADDGSEFPEWKEKKLGEITQKVVRKADDKSMADVRMISQGNGFILQSKKYSRENAGESLKKYTLLKKNEFAYNHGASKVKPYGVCYRLIESDETRVPYVYHTFRLKNGNEDYWNYALNTSEMDKQLKKMVSSGVRMDGLLNINYETYMSVKVLVPSLPEQHKIADLLSAVDDVIAAQEAEVAAWQERKKGVMRKLFSQEVRFKADDGSDFPDWEERTFADVFIMLRNNTLSRDCLNAESGQARNIHYGDVLVKYGFIVDIQNNQVPFVNSDVECKRWDRLKDGDIVIADTAEDDSVGKAVEVTNTGSEVVYSGLHTIACRPRESFARNYLGYYMNSDAYHDQLRPYMQGIKVTSVSKGNIALTRMSVPSLPEQRKIADCLTSLDDAIAKAKDELDAWRELKKGLLQQMFV